MEIALRIGPFEAVVRLLSARSPTRLVANMQQRKASSDLTHGIPFCVRSIGHA